MDQQKSRARVLFLCSAYKYESSTGENTSTKFATRDSRYEYSYDKRQFLAQKRAGRRQMALTRTRTRMRTHTWLILPGASQRFTAPEMSREEEEEYSLLMSNSK
eukprot:scaffold308412_cov34-Prasinocladus_malaysianus.AAC.2